ncbi:MAG: CvpA family protein [Candidatus Omnitrophota bacterium]
MAWKDLLSQFNWIDIFIVIILLRSSYMGIKQGFVTELFKLLGIILNIYLSLHYYPLLGNFFSQKSPLPQGIANIFSYLSIGFGLFIVFGLVRHSLLTIIRIETTDLLSRWGGVTLGLIRGILIASLVCLFFLICNNGYLKGSLRQSYFGERIVMAAPTTYRMIFRGLVVKFSPGSRINKDVFAGGE